ncbi:hypothetical protein VTO42DRAFT_6793 [Malbranchea cinnamomea]
MADGCAACILIVITLFLPPAGVFFISGCSPDFFINICLTLLGYLPGHIHAFYCEYVYYDRRARGRTGRLATRPAPGIFSKRIQNGGETEIPRDYNYNYSPAPPLQTGHAPNTSMQGQVPETVAGPRYY